MLAGSKEWLCDASISSRQAQAGTAYFRVVSRQGLLGFTVQVSVLKCTAAC